MLTKTLGYSSVACSKATLLKPFYLKKFRKLRYLYTFPFQNSNMGQLRSCEDITNLLHDLIPDKRTIQWKKVFVYMISEIN